MVQGQAFLKGGTGTFLIQFFQGLSFLRLEIKNFSYAKSSIGDTDTSFLPYKQPDLVN